MHEVSLVDALLDEVRVRAAGGTVRAIVVRHATTIPHEVLRQAFELLTQGDPLADATLEAQPFEILLRCDCGFHGPLGHDDMLGPTMAACPRCGALRRTPATPELELLEVTAGPGSG
jgi:Zn finger protein HypA/HybF involved in hydrogenase expression